MKIPRTIVALLAVDVFLTALAAYLALKPRPMVVVPGAQERAVPADTPDENSILSFGLLLAMNFDNYTHTTIDEQDRFVMSKASPRFATELERVLADRKALVKESKMSSQIAIVDPATVTVKPSPSGFWDVEFRAAKQVFVADRLSWRDRFEYRIAVEAAPPTRANPYGLALAGISIAKAGGKNANVEDR